MKNLIKDIKFAFKFNKEAVYILLGAFLFALAGDLLYGGVEGAEASLVGSVMSGASNLFFTVFLIMVLFKLVLRVLTSDKFYNIIRNLPGPANETKPERAPTTSRRIKR